MISLIETLLSESLAESAALVRPGSDLRALRTLNLFISLALSGRENSMKKMIKKNSHPYNLAESVYCYYLISQ